MEQLFIYGKAVSGNNFTDRQEETRRMLMNFTNGVNTILISPRRMGKTSLVQKVKDSISDEKIKVIMMDIYDCRSEYDFYERYASAVLTGISGKVEILMKNIKEFFYRVSPKISITPDLANEYSLSLGITPKTHKPEDILNLTEQIAVKKGIHIVVCIDEFQQIGEFPESIRIQKVLRSFWQRHKRTSYCLFGSKKHMMQTIFQSRNMPFYLFGDMITLGPIPTEDWTKYIRSKFKKAKKNITEEQASRICTSVDNYSSYVQQFAWNVMVVAGDTVKEKDIQTGLATLQNQVSGLFMQQIAGLTTYQMNFLRAIASGVHDNFGSVETLGRYKLGGKSNIARLCKTLEDKELIEVRKEGTFFSDPVFKIW